MSKDKHCSSCGGNLPAGSPEGVCAACLLPAVLEPVLQRAIDRLRTEYVGTGKSALFEELKEFLSEKQPTPHEEVARRLGISPGAVGVAIHRLRQSYRRLLRDEIAQTVKHIDDIDDEIRYQN